MENHKQKTTLRALYKHYKNTLQNKSLPVPLKVLNKQNTIAQFTTKNTQQQQTHRPHY